MTSRNESADVTIQYQQKLHNYSYLDVMKMTYITDIYTSA